MSGKTKIEWADKVWNPVVGCSKVSEGCRNCYAEAMAKRLKAMGRPEYQDVVDGRGWTGKVRLVEERLEEPLHWKKPARILIDSMSDLFHPEVPFEFLDEIGMIVTACHGLDHTFMILTKRPDWMAEYFKVYPNQAENVWLGVSVEDQPSADERIPELLKIKNRGKFFVSYEPALGPVDFTRIKWARIPVDPANYERHGVPAPDVMWSMNNALISRDGDEYNQPKIGLDWVICGGESGTGARPMHPDWVRSVRDQCQAAGVPFFFKQWGEWVEARKFFSFTSWVGKAKTWVWPGDICIDQAGMVCKIGKDFEKAEFPVTVMRLVGKKEAGKLLDGREWNEFPPT